MHVDVIPHDSWAEVYDEVYKRSFGAFYNDLTKVTLEVINKIVPKHGKIIDFGAGTGRLSIPLAQEGFSVIAVEPSKAMLHQLQRKKGNLSIQAIPVKIEECTATGENDLALCVFTVILYLLDEKSLKKSFQVVYNSLKKDGLFLLDVPTSYLFQSFHYDDDNMERNVQIVQQENENLYSYQEDVIFQKEGKSYHYNDSFIIKHWEEDTVLNVLEEVGFKIEKDLSLYFSGSGSHYYACRK